MSISDKYIRDAIEKAYEKYDLNRDQNLDAN